MKFLEPLHLLHEELQSSYSYLRFLELEWEIQWNREQLKKQSTWDLPEYGTNAIVWRALSKAFPIQRVKEVPAIGTVSLILSSSSKCAFSNSSLQILKLRYLVITYAIPIAVNIYIGKSINSKVANKNLKGSLLGFGCNNTSVCFIIFSVHNLVHSALLRRFSRWASSSVFSAWPSFSSVNYELVRQGENTQFTEIISQDKFKTVTIHSY